MANPEGFDRGTRILRSLIARIRPVDSDRIVAFRGETPRTAKFMPDRA